MRKKIILATFSTFSSASCIEYMQEENVEKYSDNILISDLPKVVQTDTFKKSAVKPYDILFIIDKSCSMENNVNTVNTEISTFLGELNLNWIDYRIGVISMTNIPVYSGILGYYYFDDSQYTRWIEPFMVDPTSVFLSLNNDVPYDGEAGIDSLGFFLDTKIGKNDNFLRFGSTFLVIFISDEEDSSYIYTDKAIQELIFSKEENLKINTKIMSIINMPNDGCEIDFYESYGFKYADLTQQLNGSITPLCQIDWSQTISEIGNYSADENVFCLSNLPEADTISVLIETINNVVYNPLPPDWVYDEISNCITIEDFPVPASSLIKISYTLR